MTELRERIEKRLATAVEADDPAVAEMVLGQLPRLIRMARQPAGTMPAGDVFAQGRTMLAYAPPILVDVAGKLAAKSPIVMKIGRDAFMRAVDADFRRQVENAAEGFALAATPEADRQTLIKTARQVLEDCQRRAQQCMRWDEAPSVPQHHNGD